MSDERSDEEITTLRIPFFFFVIPSAAPRGDGCMARRLGWVAYACDERDEMKWRVMPWCDGMLTLYMTRWDEMDCCAGLEGRDCTDATRRDEKTR